MMNPETPSSIGKTISPTMMSISVPKNSPTTTNNISSKSGVMIGRQSAPLQSVRWTVVAHT